MEVLQQALGYLYDDDQSVRLDLGQRLRTDFL